MGQFADSATTLYGLEVAGAYERNPIVRHLVEQLGVGLGLLLANLVALALLVTAVEVGARCCRELAVPESKVRLLRAGGYGFFATCSFGAALHNLRVLAAA